MIPGMVGAGEVAELAERVDFTERMLPRETDRKGKA